VVSAVTALAYPIAAAAVYPHHQHAWTATMATTSLKELVLNVP